MNDKSCAAMVGHARVLIENDGFLDFNQLFGEGIISKANLLRVAAEATRLMGPDGLLAVEALIADQTSQEAQLALQTLKAVTNSLDKTNLVSLKAAFSEYLQKSLITLHKPAAGTRL